MHLVLDYEAVRTKKKGCEKPIQVYTSELVKPEVFIFPLEEAANLQLALFKADRELLSIDPRESLPFGEDPPEPAKRKRRPYVTLERCIRFGKTVGCKGCDRIAEGVRHSDECHARIGKLLEDERLAKESDSKKDKEKSEAAVDISMHTLKDKCSHQKVKENPIVLPEGHESKLQASLVDCCNAEALNDYWDFDEAKAAWKRIHVRPRKRLFTPLGNDCPFDPFEVTTERQTVWT